MKSIERLVAICMITAVVTAGGCGGAGPENENAAEPSDDPAENRALLNAVQEPLNRAHEVEDIAAGRKGELDKEIEESDQ